MYFIFDPRPPFFKDENFNLEGLSLAIAMFKVNFFDLEALLFSDSAFKVQIGDADNNLDRLFVQI
jgi:hypothetical protein